MFVSVNLSVHLSKGIESDIRDFLARALLLNCGSVVFLNWRGEAGGMSACAPISAPWLSTALSEKSRLLCPHAASYFVAVDFPEPFRIDPSGATATSSIQNFPLTMPAAPSFRPRVVHAT